MSEKEKKSTIETDETLTQEESEVFTLEQKTELENKLEESKKSADEYKDKWMRSVAEFDNYKKRNAKVWQDAFTEGATDTVKKILPVGDNLEYALSMDLDEKTHDGLVKIKQQYDQTLLQMEVTEINPVGEPFDPNVAEAVMQVEALEGETSDTVRQVFQKGYRLKDKIIRYAKVSVVK